MADLLIDNVAGAGIGSHLALFGVSNVRIVVAVLVAYLFIRFGLTLLRGMAAPIPKPPPPGELRRVKLLYRCELCGTEVRMTMSNDQEPDSPRHCMQEMDLLTPVEDR